MALVGGCLLVLAACGAGDDVEVADSTSSTVSTISTSTASSTTTASTTSSTTTTTRARRKIAYPSGGARGPVVPPQTNAYQLMSSGGQACRTLLDEVTDTDDGWGDPTPTPDDPDVTTNGVQLTQYYLYRAAARACLQDWRGAVEDLQRLEALHPSFDQSCDSWDSRNECERCYAVVLAWLRDAVQAYRADPGHPPEFVPSNGQDRCAGETTNTTGE